MEGAFHIIYKEALRAIYEADERRNYNKHAQQPLSKVFLENRMFNPPYDELLGTLMQIFEHINFFNLLTDENSQNVSGGDLWLYRFIKK